MKVHVILVICICLGAVSTMAQKTKKSRKQNEPRQRSKAPIVKATTPVVAPVAIAPANEVKVAEQLVDIAQRLLRMLKTGSRNKESPKHTCPNGKPEAVCPGEPCRIWECSNIREVVCINQCHTCDPLFSVRGNDVTHICEKVRVSDTMGPGMMSGGPDPGFPAGSDPGVGSQGQGDPTAGFFPFPFSVFPMMPPPNGEAPADGPFARLFTPMEGTSTKTGMDAASRSNNGKRTARRRKSTRENKRQ